MVDNRITRAALLGGHTVVAEVGRGHGVDHFGVLGSHHCPGEGVVVAIRTRTDWGCDLNFGQPVGLCRDRY